jgi:hypothetical protein
MDVSESVAKVASLQHVRVVRLRKVVAFARIACVPSKALGTE